MIDSKNMSASVKLVFKCQEKESADLKIRLRHDGLQQGQFFRAIMRMYNSQHPLMISLVAQIKEESKVMGKRRVRLSNSDLKKGRNLLEDLGITQTDKESLFELIEFEKNEEYD